MPSYKRISYTRQAIRDSIRGQAVGAVFDQVLINGGVLALLLLALGASKFEVGLIFTANFLAQTVRVFAARLVDVSHQRRFILRGFTAGTVVSLGYLAVVPVAWMFGPRAALWMTLGIFLLSRVILNWGASAWFPLLGQILPAALRGRYFGQMRRAHRSTSLLATLIAGAYLGTDPELARFLPVLAVGLVLSVGRLVLFRRLPDPPPLRRGRPEPLLRNLARPLGDRPFRRFIAFTLLAGAVNAAAMPFAVPFLKTNLAFPASMTVYAAAGLSVGSILTLTWWGRVADRWGNRFTALLAMGGIAAALLTFALTPAYESGWAWLALLPGAAAFTLLGIGTSGLGIATTVRLMHQAPEAHRGAYMALFATSNGLSNALVALLAGALLDRLPDAVLIGGTSVDAMRLYFGGLAAAALAVTPALRLLPPLAERPLREVLPRLAGELPRPLAPLSLLLNRKQ